MIKAIIFDFDGVILESVQIKAEAFKEIYNDYGTDVIKRVEEQNLKDGGISRFNKFKLYHKKFLNIDLTKEDIVNLSTKFSSIVFNKIIHASFVKGAYEFIKSNNYYDIFISSATPENELIDIVRKKKIYKFFKGIYGSPLTKEEHIKFILKNNNYLQKEVLFVGDSLTDKEAAYSNKLLFVARVNSKESALYKEKNKISDLSQLIDMINLNQSNYE